MVKARVRKSSSYTVTERSFALLHQGWLATRFNRPSPKSMHDCDGAEVIQDGCDRGSIIAYIERVNFLLR
jgi:glucose-6-phosphate dehydrogenase assembly protein OpcA